MKKLLKVLGILLLITVILFAAVCVWLHFANKKMDFEPDDILEYAFAAPMTDGERYSFSADGDTMTLSLDRRDIYWFINQKYGDAFFDGLEPELSSYGIVLKGTAIALEDDHVIFKAKAGYGPLTINVWIPCSLTCDDSSFHLKPEAVRALGMDFTDRIGYDLSGFSLDIPYDHLMLERIDSMKTSDGRIRLTGPMKVNYMGMAREGFTREELEKMQDDSRCAYAAKILYKYAEDPDEGKHYWMTVLENDPSLFTTVFEQLFSMISPQTFGGYHVNELNGGMIFRLIPSYSPLDYQENYKLLAEDYK